MSIRSLNTFLVRVTANAEADNPITAYALLHEKGSTRKQIHYTKLGGKFMKPNELAEMYFEVAKTYCKEMETTQWFELGAIYSGESPEAFQPFKIDPQTEHKSIEESNEKGMVRTGQRMLSDLHNSVLERQLQLDNAYSTILLRQNQIIQTFGERIEGLAHENAEAFNVVKQLVSDKVLSNNEHQMKVIQANQSAEERRKFIQLVPPLVNTVMGREIFPQSTSDTALIDTIAENLKEEHIKQLMGLTLPPEIMGVLMNRLNEAAEKKEKREQARLLGPHPNPEEEAAGNE
jgi:hypothetical protein